MKLRAGPRMSDDVIEELRNDERCALAEELVEEWAPRDEVL